jgi:hypothetical protein
VPKLKFYYKHLIETFVEDGKYVFLLVTESRVLCSLVFVCCPFLMSVKEGRILAQAYAELF